MIQLRIMEMVGFTELAFMHQHYIALKSCLNRKLDARMEDQSAPP